MALRKGQKELIEQYRGGLCGVPAIPGGGKTFSLTMWVAEMISKGLHKPGKILILTYMNSAVNNFKQRINEELKQRGIANPSRHYHVSTIHSFCLQIIKEKPDLVLTNEEFDVIDDIKKLQIINNSIDQWKKDNFDLFRFYTDEQNINRYRINTTYTNWQRTICSLAIKIISELKSNGINPPQALELCSRLDDKSILKWLVHIYASYDKTLKINGLFDYDDMLQKAYYLLQTDDDLLSKYRDSYKYICEDEAQDSNIIQNKILELIAGEQANLLRVGDSNQSITSTFANSDYTLFNSFCNRPDTKIFNLTQSSRSTKDIIDLANYFVSFVTDNHPVSQCKQSLIKQYIEPVPSDDEFANPVVAGYGIRIGTFKTSDSENSGVAEQLEQLLIKFPGKTFAVLCPDSFKIQKLLSELKNRNIPFEELSNTSEERNRPIKKLGRVIAFIACPENNQNFYNMVTDVIINEKHEDTQAFTSFLQHYPVEKIIYPIGGEIDFSDIPKEVLESSIWAEFYENIDLIKQFLEFPITIPEKLVLFISEKLNFDREERAIAQKIANDVRYLAAQTPGWTLTDFAIELNNPKNLFNYFAGIVWELKGYKPKQGIVTVSTYHKAKGLEWDIVFLTHISNQDFPVLLTDKFRGEYRYLKEEYRNPLAFAKAELNTLMKHGNSEDIITKSKIETISERTRLLYVGITRAKEYLYLSAVSGKSHLVPSMYFDELKKFIERNIIK